MRRRSVSLPEEFCVNLDDEARRESVKERKTVTFNDLIRRRLGIGEPA